MRIGSLFTGTGALDMAARSVLGGELTWCSDIKPAAVRFLAERYLDVPNLGDITRIDPRDVDPVDVLTFGWPCQPHSSAGKRLGEADPRALWPEVHRLIVGLRPRILLGENVARIRTNGELRRVVRSLAEVGYVGSYRTLRASDVGAPHRRDRVFLVATDAAADPAPEHDHRSRAAGTCGWDEPPDGRDSAGLTLLPTPAVADARNTRNATAGRSEGQGHHHSGWTLSDVAYAERWGVYAEAIAHWEQVLGRPAPEPVRGTTRVGKPLLNAEFAEWMMGLPAGWVTEVPGLTRNQQLSMIGDGVVPAQASAAFAELLAEPSCTCERAA